MTNDRLLILLLLLYQCYLSISGQSRTKSSTHLSSTVNFQFTSQNYNTSIEENARGKEVYVVSKDTLKMGVRMPTADSLIKFRIVEGEKQHFKAETRVVGDFAFLRIRYRHDGFLNRELKDHYVLMVKATCRRKDASNLETTTTVHISVSDKNDAKPMFEEAEYSASVSDQLPPFSKILQVKASDADVGLNGEIYYSFRNHSPLFTVDPVSGWIRSLGNVPSGVYTLLLLAEDRESRLSKLRPDISDDDELFKPPVNFNEATATITVIATKVVHPLINVEKKSILISQLNISQIVAIIKVENVDNGSSILSIVDGDYAHAFRLKRESDSDEWLLLTVPGNPIRNGWTIQVKAVIIGDILRSATANVRVEVDEGRQLKFTVDLPVYHFTVNESAPIGHIVSRIAAVVHNGFDSDNQKILYSISDDIVGEDNSTVPFGIDHRTGVIRVKEWLDFEKKNTYSFHVVAKLVDYQKEVKRQVNITVLDSNDHSPVFAAKWARGVPVAISRNTPIGKAIVRVDALDSDSGDNGRVHYLVSNYNQTPFNVDFDSGEVILQRSLPRGQTFWRLYIQATDSGWPYPRSSQLILTIYINGTKIPPKIWPTIIRDPPNEHSPVFENNTEPPIVSEIAEIGDFVVVLHAIDADRGYAGIVRYATTDEYFDIDACSGRITVSNSLGDLLSDRKKVRNGRTTHVMNVTSYDMGEPVRSSNHSVVIIVEDANNNAPVFEKSFYRIRIPENTPIGSDILVLSATDDDCDENGRVAYTLTGDTEYLDIDPEKGILRVRKELDREISDVHRFTVIAHDHGQPPQLSFVNVTLVLDDVNDNAPTCIETIQRIQIPEDYPNGALVTCIAASDPDVGENGRITYGFDSTVDMIAAKIPFEIDKESGCLFVNSPKPLDFETRPVYNLSVEVMDNGQPTFSSVCTVLVELTDVNENVHPPVFEEIAFEASVFENEPIGAEVITISATDPDDPNSSLRYSIVDGDGLGFFVIDPEGIIRTNVILDREVQSHYWLTVEVEDDGSVPLSSITHIYVRVLDRNDHAPLPERPIYFTTVPENSPENTVVVKIEGRDNDNVNGDGFIGQLSYRIKSGDPQSFFAVDPLTGYMITRGRRHLDRETQKEHVVLIEMCDKGVPEPLCTTVPVVIEVGDLNDNPPKFQQSVYTVNVPAGEEGELCRIFATDADVGANAEIYYNITSDDKRFEVNQFGVISAKEALKAEEIVQFTLNAYDKGKPQNSASCRVVLNAVGRRNVAKDTNKKPILLHEQQWSHLSISDADNIGETVGLVKAHDPDGDQLWWRILNGNHNNVFSIRTDAGELFLARSLDAIADNITEYHLTIGVSDGLEEVSGKITVEVSRSTQRRPRFSAQHYKVQISENVPLGTVIYTMKASLDKTGLNHKLASDRLIVYGIHSVENIGVIDKLRIDSSSGNVIVMESFNRDVTREFSVVFFAGNGQLFDLATLSISLLEANNNKPRFLQSEYSRKLMASSPIGTPVITVRAFDPDSGDSGTLIYSIITGNRDEKFTINKVTGEIRTNRSLQTEIHDETLLSIGVSDNGKVKLSDMCTVRIETVADTTSTPIFSRSVYSISARENSPVGHQLLMVYAESVLRVKYSLFDPCPNLSVHPFSGVVYIRHQFNQEKDGNTMNCTINAVNSYGATNTAVISIKILDVNEHAPFFNQTFYEGYIQENMPPGTAVFLENGDPLIVKAFDYDTGPGALISYRVVSPFEPYFTVDFVSGAVRSKKVLDYEKLRSWSIHVQASDMGKTVLSSPVPAYVRINIKDSNDMSPKFVLKEFAMALVLPTVRGARLGRAKAEDPDTIGRLRFAITSAEMKKLFSIDNSDGTLSVNADSATLYTKQTYDVPLVVTDGLHSDSAFVHVQVINSSTESNALRFIQPEYRTQLTENQNSSSPVALITVSTVTSRAGETVMYRLLNPRPEFVVSAGSGVISWTGILIDREQYSRISLIVEARTIGQKTATAQCIVVVDIEDVNDNAPMFINLPYMATVSTHAKRGDNVITVKAVDADTAQNAVIRYSLEKRSSFFAINKYNGRISVMNSLEKVDHSSEHLMVIATDQGKPALSSSVPVHIDIVDHSLPMFLNRFYHGEISEDAPPGSVILTVKAVSAVSDHIGYLLISGDPTKRFKIDFTTGSLSVHQTLDRELTDSYNLTIAAIDTTQNGVSAECIVNVAVDDVNDNAPIFERPLYSVNLPESTSIGAVILKVTAKDLDLAAEEITYGLSGPNASVFIIDSMTGEISLKKPLDFEVQQSYTFTVTAADSAQLTSEAIVILYVDDVNDVAPKFRQSLINASVFDDAEPPQFITMLDVDDPDTVSSLEGGYRLLFSIIEGDETLIDIDKHTGVVKLARPIVGDDMEQTERYFNISVTDGVFTTFSRLLLSLERSPSQIPPPHFQHRHYAISVKENGNAGAKLLTVKAEGGIPPLQYLLGGENGLNIWPVSFDSANGTIRSKISFDYETCSQYHIPLVVTDKDNRRAFATLSLTIVDDNDNAPKFILQSYESSIHPDADNGEALVMVSAIDKDVGDQVEYTIVKSDQSDVSDIVKVHKKQGIVTLSGSVHHLIGQQLSFFVRATDLANPPHHSEARVILHVLSANTSIPRFSRHHFLFNIPENSAVGTVVGQLQNDQRNIPDTQYLLVANSETADLPFSLDRSTAKLIVNSHLDREKVSEWRFIVRVLCSSNPIGTTALVTVRVNDVNDNAPLFQGSYEDITISEDSPIGSSVAIVSATDADIGPNSRVFFSLEKDEDSTDFKIDSETGWLVVARKLDRENKDEYKLRVVASDKGSLNATKMIVIRILDANDSPPIFSESLYSVEKNESDLIDGGELLRILVKDADLPPFNSTKLVIKSGNMFGAFHLRDNGSLVFRKRILPQGFYGVIHNMSLLAFDGRHSSTAQLKIKILPDLSDMKCSNEPLRLSVSEDITVNTMITNGYHQSFTYSLFGDKCSEFFKVCKNGSLAIASSLDRESRENYECYLRAESPKRHILCIRPIYIAVTDVNDNSPVFLKSIYTFTVKENLNVSESKPFLIARIEAEDFDSGEFGQITYKFAKEIDRDTQSYFILNSTWGTLSAVKPFDRESRHQYILYICAIDGGGKSSKAKVVVNVADVNDNEPIFESIVYQASVLEDERIGYEIIKVRATGGDSGETVTYQLESAADGAEYFAVHPQSGILTLKSPLDYEKTQKIAVIVTATDSGNPPLSSKCTIEVEVLDVNDNKPIFAKTVYKANVLENSPIGTKVIKIVANDKDSEHFGRVTYSLTGAMDRFIVDEDGWIKVSGPIDREDKSAYRLTVTATDGGSPALSGITSVIVEIDDVNDNPPVFQQCNMTAIVQENADPGHPLLSVSLSDADVEPHAGPFSLDIMGSDSGSFVFDSKMNLITAVRLSHSRKSVYLLTVRALDQGGLATECPLTVFVREESRHPPVVMPLSVTLNTIMGEFLGGKIGIIQAEDEDTADMLRYTIVSNDRESSPPPTGFSSRMEFSVNGETGEIFAEADLLSGVHRFNVSVTDGKYIVVTHVLVDVSPIDQDALDHSISMRIRRMSGTQFIDTYAKRFAHSLSRYMNVKPTDVRILSIQEATNGLSSSFGSSRQRRLAFHRYRNLRQLKTKEIDLDVLLTVSRGDSRGYFRPNFIRQRLEQNIVELSEDSGLEIVSLTTEICRRDTCVKGDCRDRLYLDDTHHVRYDTNEHSFYAPRHIRTFECICRDGYGGTRCEIPVDKCSRDQCTRDEMCVPMQTDVGFECICPPGTKGDRCSLPSCSNDIRHCSQDAELSVDGNGFFQITIANSLERRLELSVNIRTGSYDGVVMHGAGNGDFHSLEIVRGYMEYRWECGSGIGTVRVDSIRVSDGQWHNVKVSRRGRYVRLAIDETYFSDGHSPSGSDVVNLYGNAMRLTFGALVSFPNSGNDASMASDLRPLVTRGMVGCFGRISLDGFVLPKSKQGLKLYNARLGCILIQSAPCSVNPCVNSGTCTPTDDVSFTCTCPPRYTGTICDIDLDVCATRPCPPGVQCHNLVNDFFCICPRGFTGKTCQMRGAWNPCLSSPCGPNGKCIRIDHSSRYLCNCSHGYSGTTCSDRDLSSSIAFFTFNLTTVLFITATAALLILLLCVICLCIRFRKHRYSKPSHQKDFEYDTNLFNPSVRKAADSGSLIREPPPLPPRGLRSAHTNQLSNFEAAQLTGLPTVQVRPLQANERLNGNSSPGRSRSPSIANSGKLKKHQRSSTPKMNRSVDSMKVVTDTSADEKENQQELLQLRKYGRRIPENEDEAGSSSSSPPFSVPNNRRIDRRFRRRVADFLEHSYENGSVSLTSEDNWRQKCDKRIVGACNVAAEKRSERLKIDQHAKNRITVGDTVLSPVEADDEYMTMRPASRRLIPPSTESQRRPLLENSDSDGCEDNDIVYPDEIPQSERLKPRPPAHSNRRKSHKVDRKQSRVYDNPPTNSFTGPHNSAAKLPDFAVCSKEQSKKKPISIGSFEDIDASDHGDSTKPASADLHSPPTIQSSVIL